MQIDRPITIAIILFAILLLVFFLVVPEYKTFAGLRMQLGEKRAEFNAKFDYYAAITKSHNDLQAHQEDIKKIDNALPAEPQDPAIGKIIYFLQETARGEGLVVKNLFLSKSSNSADSDSNLPQAVKDMVFSVDVMGDYPALENFIISLEKSERIFEVTSISFNSQSGPPYSFVLQIKTYSY